ncbi:hypothetical protein MNV49_007836, partial [Pseudohyphozyma bogoriensis]
ELEEAENGLREVVGKLMERMEEREKEEREREKERSRKGLSRPEGVEEGETAEEKEERAVGWWRLGRCLWEMGETDPDKNGEAFDAFISSVKASNTFAPAFTSLGTFYETVEPADFKRAFECYKKAFELDGSQEVAALFLAQEFSEEGEWTLVEKIARRVVQGSAGGAGSAALGGKAAKRLSWAWKAIGGAELNSQKYPQAIAAFQSALRGAPDDSHTWIRLGIAYRESGKFIAALKVFVKALSLDPDSWYAKFLIGDVQKEIGLLEPAIKVFREILEDRPDELGVRVVLAETALAKGQDEFNGNFLGRAEESLIVALEEASKIIDAGSATRVAWKVAGDALVGLGKIPLPASLDRSTPLALHLLEVIGKADVDTRIEGMDGVRVEALRQAVHNAANPAFFLALAVLASKMRVLLETQNEVSIGSAWLDLGLSLSAIRPHLAPLGLPSAEHDALLQAVRCIKYALHKEPVNASFWNALGVLAFDLSPRLTQHAFIKSIEYNSRTAVPWANLGVFYLVHGDEDLANEAFLKAQVLDPDYGAAWVGQARLATLAGHTREASVLLEHAFTLGATTPEADVGYAESAFKAFRAQSKAKATTSQTREEASAALSGPLFAISRYLSKHPTDVSALHLSALILERVGDLDSASAALEKAAEMLSEIYDAEESPEAEARYIVSQTNLGRVRLAKEDFEGALEAFEPPLALLPLPGEARDVEGALKKEEAILLYTECRLGSAMASFWNGDAGAAKDQLSDALEDLEAVEGGKKANLGTCLARIYWSEEDIDRSLGSMLDVPDIVSPKSPLFVKLVMEAMGTMTQERVTLEVVERLSRRDTAVKYDHDFTRLKALEKLLKGDQVGATSIVSRTLHATPWENHTRRALAWLLIELTPTPSASSNQNLSSVSRTTALRAQLTAPGPESAGDGGVGKSSITTSLLKRDFSDEYDPTVEDSYSTTMTIEGQQYDIEIVDTAGQEEYRGLWGEQTVREGDGFILTYSIDSESSFRLLPSFAHTIRKVKSPDENPTEAATPENTPFPFMVLGNKCDLPPSSRVISASTGLSYSRSLGGLFYECSAKLRVNIDACFLSLVRATAKSRAARLDYIRRRGTEEGFNGNIAVVEKGLGGGMRLGGVRSGEGGWEEDENEELEKARAARKKNKDLSMDRRRSFSVGGLGAHPDTLRDEGGGGGCCASCVVS